MLTLGIVSGIWELQLSRTAFQVTLPDFVSSQVVPTRTVNSLDTFDQGTERGVYIVEAVMSSQFTITMQVSFACVFKLQFRGLMLNARLIAGELCSANRTSASSR